MQKGIAQTRGTARADRRVRTSATRAARSTRRGWKRSSSTICSKWPKRPRSPQRSARKAAAPTRARTIQDRDDANWLCHSLYFPKDKRVEQARRELHAEDRSSRCSRPFVRTECWKRENRAMQVSVYRYNPETDEVPRMQDMLDRAAGRKGPDGARRAGAAEGAGPVADVSSLVPRRRVRLRRHEHERQERPRVHHAGVEVAKKDKLVLRPLPGLPVIRDLVVDMSQFYKQYEKIQPIPASTINRRRRKNGCSRRKIARSSTDCTSASCARVARRRVRRSGGTRRSSSVLQGCCRHIGSSPTAATLRPQNVWPNSTIRSASSAAAAS